MTAYNVVAMGPPGSGKTVFLAALYNALSSGNLASGLRVALDRESAAWLNAAYQQIADPTAMWPSGTDPSRPMREVVMSFAVQRTRRPFLIGKPRLVRYPAFSVTYIDYAGEWLTDLHRQDPELTASFKSRLEDAHVVFCFLDGHRLLRLLGGRDAAEGKLINELRYTLQQSMAGPEPIPIVVVLTKWDLLEHRYTLGDVADSLAHLGLREMANERSYRRWLTKRPQGGIWLVPVTATGSSFVRVAAGGAVEKAGRGSPAPRNILVPLSLGIVDISDMALADYRKANAPGSGWVSSLQRFVQGGVGTVSGTSDGTAVNVAGVTFDIRKAIAFSGELSVGAVRLLSWPALMTVQLLHRRVRRVRARGLDGVSSAEGALMYVGIAIQDKLGQFSRDPGYRASVLWSDGDRHQVR